MKGRTKYYPPSDLACGFNVENIERLYDSQKTEVDDINEALEFYNLYLYFNDKKTIWKRWTNDQVNKYKEFSEVLKNSVFKYIASLDDSSFIAGMENIEAEYIDDLIKVLQQATNFSNISNKAITAILEKSEIFIYHAIKNEKFVNYYGDVIKKYLISKGAAEIIISSEDSKNNNTVTRTFIPKCLTEEERNSIIEKYINSPVINPNYLDLLISVPFEKKIPLPLIVAAKNKLDEYEKKILSSTGKSLSFSLHFEKGQKEKVIITNPHHNILSLDISYSLDWISNNLNYGSILHNFIDMFGFVDNQYRIINMNKHIDAGIIDSLTMLKNSKVYQKNMIFDFYEGLLNNELFAYRNILLNKGIFLEKMAEAFFSDFLVTEYNFPTITTHLSIDNKSYLEKCYELVTNLDIICKQFFHFATYKTIDKNLLQADNKPVKIECIPSLVKNKYVQGNGVIYHGIVYALFSNQCLLNYIPSKKVQYECFFDLLQNETVSKSDYPEYEHQIIEELVKWDLIAINKKDYISIKNQNRVMVLRDLYRNEFINFNRFDEETKNEILEMNNLGLVVFEDNLLSHQESAYFNYYLNDTYPNGPKLRNRYVHGIEYLESDEKVHLSNYIIILRLLILLILKINDDVCLFYNTTKRLDQIIPKDGYL